jgi:hypothetical protein
MLGSGRTPKSGIQLPGRSKLWLKVAAAVITTVNSSFTSLLPGCYGTCVGSGVPIIEVARVGKRHMLCTNHAALRQEASSSLSLYVWKPRCSSRKEDYRHAYLNRVIPEDLAT